MKGRYMLLAAVAPVMVIGSQAAAQPVQAAPAQQGNEAQPDEGLDIVVTAQRRSEGAQRVPISLTALSAESLEKTNILSVQDIGRVAPGFNAFRSAQAANTRLSIRGIGSPGNAAIEPSVGAFVDGIYIPRPGPLLAGLNDISSIEVLRGPQGTLFGRNASVGAISFHTAEPSRDSGGLVAVEGGNYGLFRARATMNAPVSDTVATRLAVLYENTNGYGLNLLTGQRFGKKDTLSLRGSFRAEITPTLTWLVRGDYQRQSGDGQSAVTVDADTVTPTFAANFSTRLNGLIPRLDATYDYAVRQYTEGRLSDDQGGVSSDLSLEVGQSTIRLLSGLRAWQNSQSELDIPYTQALLLGRDAEYRSNSHSQELQFISPANKPLTFVGGLYYFRERYITNTVINLGPDLCNVYVRNVQPAQLATCLAGPQANAASNRFDQVTQSYAAYGQGTYRVTPWWDVTVGLRYSQDDKTATLVSVLGNPLAASLNAPDNAQLVFNGGKATYRLNTTFRPAPDVMLFATMSTGYKSGGFDTGVGNTLGNNRVFNPETVTNYEIGAKTQFLNRRVTLNATLFRMDVDDFQLRSFNGTFYLVRNAGSIRQQGVEFDVALRLARSLTFSLSGTRLDSQYTDFRNAPPRPGRTGVQDLTGTRVPYSPEWQGTAAIDYTSRFDSGWEVDANVHLGFTSDIDVGIAGDGNPQGIQPGYGLLGTRIAVRLPDNRWEFSLSGENLTERGYCVTKYGMTLAAGLGLASNGSTVMRCVLGEPRTVRAAVTLRF